MVIGAAVLLFIASFLSFYTATGYSDAPTAWDYLGDGLGLYIGGVIGAALIVVNRLLPQPRKIAGLELGQAGVAFSVLVVWALFWTLVDVPDGLSAGGGLILGFIASLVLVSGAIATPLLPPLQAALVPAPKPPPRSPTAPSRPVVTATPAPVPPVRVRRSPPTALRRSRRRPRSRSGSRSFTRPLRPGTSRRSGSPCRWPARCSRKTVRRRRSPNSRRVPGTWPSSSAVLPSSRRRRTAVVASFRTPRGSSAAEPHTVSHGPSPFRAGGRCRTVAAVDRSTDTPSDQLLWRRYAARSRTRVLGARALRRPSAAGAGGRAARIRLRVDGRVVGSDAFTP